MKFRPRFSIRTLAILLTLVCLYFGSWSLTDRFGVPAITSRYDGFRHAHSPAPFVVRVDSNDQTRSSFIILPGDGMTLRTTDYKRYWHLWCFGMTRKLPHESSYSVELPSPGIDMNSDGVEYE